MMVITKQIYRLALATCGWYHGIAINNPDNINADGKIKHNHGWQWHDNNDVWTNGNIYLQSSIIMTGGGYLKNNGRML